MSIKILLIGDSSVGKTSLINRFINGEFTENFTSTIGMDYKNKRIAVNNKQYDLEIIDTCGQERFHSLSESYYKRADGIIFVFDVTNESTFKNLKNHWLREIDKIENLPYIIIGNKIDLKNIRSINAEEMNQLGQKKNIRCIEASAKSGENIETIFTTLTELIISSPHRRRIKSFKLKNTTNQQRNTTNKYTFFC